VLPWQRHVPKTALRSIALQGLQTLVTSSAFDPALDGSVVIHARGPYVDLTGLANPLGVAGDRGGRVFVVVHAPDDLHAPLWPFDG
jgi:hypothetical protein